MSLRSLKSRAETVFQQAAKPQSLGIVPNRKYRAVPHRFPFIDLRMYFGRGTEFVVDDNASRDYEDIQIRG